VPLTRSFLQSVDLGARMLLCRNDSEDLMAHLQRMHCSVESMIAGLSTDCINTSHLTESISTFLTRTRTELEGSLSSLQDLASVDAPWTLDVPTALEYLQGLAARHLLFLQDQSAKLYKLQRHACTISADAVSFSNVVEQAINIILMEVQALKEIQTQCNELNHLKVPRGSRPLLESPSPHLSSATSTPGVTPIATPIATPTTSPTATLRWRVEPVVEARRTPVMFQQTRGFDTRGRFAGLQRSISPAEEDCMFSEQEFSSSSFSFSQDGPRRYSGLELEGFNEQEEENAVFTHAGVRLTPLANSLGAPSDYEVSTRYRTYHPQQDEYLSDYSPFEVSDESTLSESGMSELNDSFELDPKPPRLQIPPHHHYNHYHHPHPYSHHPYAHHSHRSLSANASPNPSPPACGRNIRAGNMFRSAYNPAEDSPFVDPSLPTLPLPSPPRLLPASCISILGGGYSPPASSSSLSFSSLTPAPKSMKRKIRVISGGAIEEEGSGVFTSQKKGFDLSKVEEEYSTPNTPKFRAVTPIDMISQRKLTFENDEEHVCGAPDAGGSWSPI
jgi:hypothetical protein